MRQGFSHFLVIALVVALLGSTLTLEYPKRFPDSFLCNSDYGTSSRSCSYQLQSVDEKICHLNRFHTPDCKERPRYTGQVCQSPNCTLRLFSYRYQYLESNAFRTTGLNLTIDVDPNLNNKILARYHFPVFDHKYCLDFATESTTSLSSLKTLWYDCHIYNSTYVNRTGLLEYSYNGFISNYTFVVPPDPTDLTLKTYVIFFYLHLHRLPQPIITLQLALPQLKQSQYLITIGRNSSCTDVLRNITWSPSLDALNSPKDTLEDIDLGPALPAASYVICVKFNDCQSCYTSQIHFSIEGSHLILYITTIFSVIVLLVTAALGGFYYYVILKQNKKAIRRGTVLLLHKSAASVEDKELVDDLERYLVETCVERVLVDYSDIPRSESRDPYTWHAEWVLDADVIVIYFPCSRSVEQASETALLTKDDNWNIYHNSFELALSVIRSNALDPNSAGTLTVLQKSVVLLGQGASPTVLPTEVRPFPRFAQTTQLKAFTRHIRRLIKQSALAKPQPAHADDGEQTGLPLTTVPNVRDQDCNDGQSKAILSIPQPPLNNLEELGDFPPTLRHIAT